MFEYEMVAVDVDEITVVDWTGAAVRKQAPVVVSHIIADMARGESDKRYGLPALYWNLMLMGLLPEGVIGGGGLSPWPSGYGLDRFHPLSEPGDSIPVLLQLAIRDEVNVELIGHPAECGTFQLIPYVDFPGVGGDEEQRQTVMLQAKRQVRHSKDPRVDRACVLDFERRHHSTGS